MDILKIDRSFLADPNPQVEEMTDSIVELARIFKLKAVAEGVENAGQLARLQGIHCDFGQGFHFAGPSRQGDPGDGHPGAGRACRPGRPWRGSAERHAVRVGLSATRRVAAKGSAD